MATASKIIKKATSYIGIKENPAGSNKVKFNTDYYGRAVKGSSYPWCCTFVWDIFRLAGASELFFGGGKTAYCPDVENYYEKTRSMAFYRTGWRFMLNGLWKKEEHRTSEL